MENLSKQLGGMYEILYYRKNHNGIWLQEEIIPIRNEESIIVLFLVTFRDITPFKGKKKVVIRRALYHTVALHWCPILVMNVWHISQQEMGTLVKCEIFVQNVFEVNICYC